MRLYVTELIKCTKEYPFDKSVCGPVIVPKYLYNETSRNVYLKEKIPNCVRQPFTMDPIRSDQYFLVENDV